MTSPQGPWIRWLRAGRSRPPEVMLLPAPIDPGDVPDLCRTLRSLTVRSRSSVVVCNVAAVTNPDAAALDALARLQLTARRLGTTVALAGVSTEFKELLEFAGLASIFPCYASSALEPIRQPEQREEAGRVEEETDPTDPAV